MKYFLLFFIVLFPFVGLAQFEINYSPVTNKLNAYYTGCDICRIGTQGNVDICECQNQCDVDCFDFCHTNNNTIAAVDYCISDCENSIGECINECGQYSEPGLEVELYIWRLKAMHDEIPNDPLLSDNLWFNNNIAQGSWPANNQSQPFWNLGIGIFPWTLNTGYDEFGNLWDLPWPEIHYTNNTCYGLEIMIFYSNGSTCSFDIWECNIIG